MLADGAAQVHGRRGGLPVRRDAAVGLALQPAAAETEVDLALVLAVDISYSMDPEEQALQREGFAQAFRSPMVHDAIRRGMIGRIAVTYFEWAGAYDQKDAEGFIKLNALRLQLLARRAAQ